MGLLMPVIPVKSYIVSFALLFLSYCMDGANLEDAKKINVFGPGVIPNLVVLPARYFYIYLNESEPLRIKEFSGKSKDIKVEITGVNVYNRDCRVWINLLDKKDGTYIVRYKLYETCYNMEIVVKYKDENVGGSPFKMNGTVQSEDCDCPTSLDQWLVDNNCPSHYSQIDKDLVHFPSVNFSLFHKLVVDKLNKSHSMSVCNYIILNNEIYRRCYGEHVGFKMFVDAILTSLARKVELPNTELFVNLGDWPLVQKNVEKQFPMFSWCGSNDTLDIVMPTYDLTESSLEMMGRVSLDMLSVQGNIKYRWEEKEPKAFWRGRDSSKERLRLIDIARQHPDLFNASLTNFFFFRDQEQNYGKTKHISFFEFFDYKYQICLDGTVAAYRLPYLLAGDSLVFKQDSGYYEHFYESLEPWKHFVPIKRDLSDLVEKIQWARDNDEKARKIAEAGQQFANANLLPQNVFCYHVVLLKEWSKKVLGDIKLREKMEKVQQVEKNKHCVCSSPMNNQHTEL